MLLSGEAGIGKSRLTAALLEALLPSRTRACAISAPHSIRTVRSIRLSARWSEPPDLAHDDTVQAKLDKLDAVLAQSFTPRQDAALFAEMLSLANDGRYPALDLAPEQRRQQTLRALGAQVEALARSKPVLMIFEDAHWTDPTSLEAFGRAVDQIKTLPVLLDRNFPPRVQAAVGRTAACDEPDAQSAWRA